MARRRSPATGASLALLAALAGGAAVAAAGGDDRVGWLRSHAVPLATVDPKSADLSDLERLRPALAGARVVLLGEATRGEGTALLVKTRLIRFLHERMGFDLLAFEGGFYDCARAWEDIRAGADPRRALEGALFPFYTQAAQFQPLFELIAASSRGQRPLAVAGIDDQIGGAAVAGDLMERMRAALASAGIDPAGIAGLAELEAALRDVVAERYLTAEAKVPSHAARRRMLATLDDLRHRLEARPAVATASGIDDAAFWAQVIANLAVYADSSWQQGEWQRDSPKKTALNNLRDRQMAANLIWLARKRYPDRKILVWSLNIHLARDLDRLTTGEADVRARFDEMSTVGDDVSKALGTEVYTIAETAFTGFVGTPSQRPSELFRPTTGSIEDLFARTGLEAAFLDLRNLPAGGAWLRRGLIARPISHKELLGIWPRHVDALLFLRTVEPSQPAGIPPRSGAG